MVTGKVEYGKNVFKLGRAGRNIVSKLDYDVDKSIYNLRKSFLQDRIKGYWNSLPEYVEASENVLDFKINLEKFKKDGIKRNIKFNFWESSDLIIEKIEGNPNYLVNKDTFNKFLIDNPWVAKKKGINTNINS